MGGYKEHKIFSMVQRKSVIAKYIFFICLIFVIAIILLGKTIKEKSIEQIVYKESSRVDYKVYLKENEFFDKQYLEDNKQYIASLINYVQTIFRYELEGQKNKEISDYKYTYKIVAETNVEDKANHNSLYKITDDLVAEKEYTAKTGSKVVINEPIKIDYNKYNDLVNQFVYLYDLENYVATLNVKMYVNIIGQNNESAKPVATLSIPLTMKTMAIDIETNSVNCNNEDECQTNNVSKYKFALILIVLLETYLIIKLSIFIKDTKNEKTIYNMRLRKIMSNYGSYIQKLNNEFDFEGYQILEIKSFEDLLQVRETINLPILMKEEALAMETYFFIPSEKNIYVYELKAGNLRKKNGKRYKEKVEI